MVIDQARWLAVRDTPLYAGLHSDYSVPFDLIRAAHSAPLRFCIMEMAAYVSGEPWSDQPRCVSRLIGDMLARWNDTLPHEARQALKALIPIIIGTNTNRTDELALVWRTIDWLVRDFTPRWLELVPTLAEHAVALRAAPVISAQAGSARDITDELLRHAYTVATQDLARLPYGVSDHDSAPCAIAHAGGVAARDAVISSAPGDHAQRIVEDTIAISAQAALWVAEQAAGDIPLERAALRPTVLACQASAMGLIKDLCAIGR